MQFLASRWFLTKILIETLLHYWMHDKGLLLRMTPHQEPNSIHHFAKKNLDPKPDSIKSVLNIKLTQTAACRGSDTIDGTRVIGSSWRGVDCSVAAPCLTNDSIQRTDISWGVNGALHGILRRFVDFNIR